MNTLIEGLVSAGHRVKVLAINTNKYSVEPRDIPQNYRNRTGIELVDIDLSVKPIPAFINLLSNKSYHVARFVADNFRKKLIEVLKVSKFNVVQIETLFMSPYIETLRKYSKAKIVLRAHNIEHLIWQRLAKSTRNPLKGFYLNHLATTLKNYEYNILDAYDGIVPITRKDSDFFGSACNKPVIPISFGVNPDQWSLNETDPIENALFHIGSMNWLPNEEGIKWFLSEVWPLLHQTLPSLKLYLAGREIPTWLRELQLNNVEVVGEAPNAQEFIRSKSISIAPLLSGSGIRIKIIESMVMGKAVIATTIGAEGINYTRGKDIMIADTPEAFREAVKYLYENPEHRIKIGNNARRLILEEHNNPALVERLGNFYREIL